MDGLTVVLIGGPPGAGKTTLTRALGARLGFLATTVDDLVTTARLVTDARSRPDPHRTQATALGLPVIHQPGDRPVDDLVDETVRVLT